MVAASGEITNRTLFQKMRLSWHDAINFFDQLDQNVRTPIRNDFSRLCVCACMKMTFLVGFVAAVSLGRHDLAPSYLHHIHTSRILKDKLERKQS